VRTVFLVPRRNDGGPRDAIWDYCRARWARYFPDIPVYEGHHDDGPFNRSAAVNRAAEVADRDGPWDVGIVIDADVVLSVSQVRAAIDRAAATGRVTWAHRRWRGVREDMTVRMVADAKDLGPELSRDELDLIVERTNPMSWSCCFAVPRVVWDSSGGFDERFQGWGFEDMAWQSLIVGLYGHERIEADVVHLWHPRSEERIVKGQGAITASREYVTNARLGRRYMYALRRDYGKHDRPTESDAEEMARDLVNLKRDDERWTVAAARHGLPDWTHWWPTLEELRDGAIAARTTVNQNVTLIVRSGGEPSAFDERVGYLRRSLTSIAERVSGPIVKRVIYADWGPEERARLAPIADEFGYRLVGPDRHVGYTVAMGHLWRYVERRVATPYVFSVEDDFTYDRDVDLVPMIDLLRERSDVRQVALLRGPYYASEIKVGGVLPSLKTPVEYVNHRPHPFVTHRDHFTANPSLFRRSLVRTPWPSGDSTERRFGDAVLADPSARFAYWGDGTPWITHIGATRAGTSY
jgi:hypothetical protein